MPELRDVPKAFIHAPWEMPPLTQQMCGVTIGTHYPEPLVDVRAAHAASRKRLTRIRQLVVGRLPEAGAGWQRIGRCDDEPRR